MNTMDQIKQLRIVPVVVIKSIEDALPIADALIAGGLPVAEVTLRTPCALEAIALIARERPTLLLGAGTVINAEQSNAAIDAGVKFIVSPGLSAAIAAVCRERDIPYLPGCATPTEIMQALELGLDHLKFFPANVYGGLGAIKALSAPFPQVRFMPTGGVDASNFTEFLSCPAIFAVGGSFMMKGNIVENCRQLMKT